MLCSWDQSGRSFFTLNGFLNNLVCVQIKRGIEKGFVGTGRYGMVSTRFSQNLAKMLKIEFNVFTIQRFSYEVHCLHPHDRIILSSFKIFTGFGQYSIKFSQTCSFLTGRIAYSFFMISQSAIRLKPLMYT